MFALPDGGGSPPPRLDGIPDLGCESAGRLQAFRHHTGIECHNGHIRLGHDLHLAGAARGDRRLAEEITGAEVSHAHLPAVGIGRRHRCFPGDDQGKAMLGAPKGNDLLTGKKGQRAGGLPNGVGVHGAVGLRTLASRCRVEHGLPDVAIPWKPVEELLGGRGWRGGGFAGPVLHGDRERNLEPMAAGDIPDSAQDRVADRQHVFIAGDSEKQPVGDREVAVTECVHLGRRLTQDAGRRLKEFEHRLLHRIGGMVVGEAHVIGFRPLEGRPGQVAEGFLVERDVGNDPHLVKQRLDVHAPPVDLDHLAGRAVGDQPVTDGERPLEEQHQARDDVAEWFLKRQPDHDAAQPEGRECA